MHIFEEASACGKFVPTSIARCQPDHIQCEECRSRKIRCDLDREKGQACPACAAAGRPCSLAAPGQGSQADMQQEAEPVTAAYNASVWDMSQMPEDDFTFLDENAVLFLW